MSYDTTNYAIMQWQKEQAAKFRREGIQIKVIPATPVDYSILSKLEPHDQTWFREKLRKRGIAHYE